VSERDAESMVTLLTSVYREPEADARRMLVTARRWGVSTAPHPRGYIRVKAGSERGKYTLDEEFLGMKAGGERKLHAR
jgi:hypothetical protein